MEEEISATHSMRSGQFRERIDAVGSSGSHFEMQLGIFPGGKGPGQRQVEPVYYGGTD